jgi:hypothetical protein
VWKYVLMSGIHGLSKKNELVKEGANEPTQATRDSSAL